jgi:hypothetical protein
MTSKKISLLSRTTLLSELLLKRTLDCVARIPRGIFIANPFASFALYRATRDSTGNIEVSIGKYVEI